MRRALVRLVVLAAVVLVPLTARADAPNPDWTSLLPAAPGAAGGPLPRQPGCERPSPRCIDHEIAAMRQLQGRLGCDHRAVFATTYLVLTEVLRDAVRRDPHLFRYPDALYAEDALFARWYFATVTADQRHRPVAPAWRIAFDTARTGEVSATVDMLLGINAHVQNDMPFVLASLGLRTRDGYSRKVDHDRFNAVLTEAYQRVVHEVADRFDPFVSVTNSDATPADDEAGLQMVRGWREQVWRNAERLTAARTPAERALVTQQIQQNAAAQARLIATGGRMPGYRPVRDAYCRAQLRGDT